MSVGPTRRQPLVLVGGFKHELNSFARGTLSFRDVVRAGYFAEGEDIFAAPRSARPELAAIRAIADREGIALLPTVHFFAASAGGPLEHDVYARAKELMRAAASANRERIDGIMLPLHGATVTTEEPDTEGDLMDALRAIVGPSVPIVATFDTHAHGTARMAAAADALVGFKTQPHVDHYETASHAMDILVRAMRGEIRPLTTHRKLAMLTSAERQDTSRSPMGDLIEVSRQMERRPGVLAVSVFTTQPWLDLPEAGWSVEVVTDGDRSLGGAIADELALMCWDRRTEFLVRKTPVGIALDDAAARTERPTILVDGADSTTAGGDGDGTELLAALADRADDIEALLTVVDEAAVEACAQAGIGATVDVEVGGRITAMFQPVRVRGQVIALSLGAMALDPPWPPTDIGRMAVLRMGSTDIVLSERRPWHIDTRVYRHVGLDPERYQVVQVKSAGGFRARYEPLAAHIVEIATTGPCDSDLARLPFRRIPRPMWPFDPDLPTPWPAGRSVVATVDRLEP